ncbi:hypothetical protein EDB80DRAFT_676035 [Ilyonectria destructans]|nr:hypothetical protein EDB80DRAFT_676035 [Ilyonectria destructans]
MAGSTTPNSPKPISGDLVWTASDFESNEAAYTENLSRNDILEIEAALKHFQALGISRGYTCPATFPLSEDLANRLRAITDRIYNGCGFHQLRGLDPTRYTEAERVIIHAGLTSYVADKRGGNIDHIRDQSLSSPEREKLKPLELPVPMTFHTDIDVGDTVSLFTQSVPLSGGEQYLASIASVYNDILEREPEVLKTLAADWYWERLFRPAANKEVIRSFNRPLIAFENGRLQINFAATFVGGNPKYPLSTNAPSLAPEKQRALQVIQEAAKRTCLKLVPEAGDILFVNNYALLHARAAWADSVHDVWKQRYIMRLWLHDSQKGWKSATALKRELGESFEVAPESQRLLTGTEWCRVPRAMRVKDMGFAGKEEHD